MDRVRALSVLCGTLLCCSAGAAGTKESTGESYICLDADTGYVVREQNAEAVRPPASMAKMMLVLLVCEGLLDGEWTLDTAVTFSRNALATGGSRINVRPDDVKRLGELMPAIVVASANNAAAAVAERLWGSEDACLARMNERAAELGRAHTVFHSVHGLSRNDDLDETTARDIAILAGHCIQHPLILEWAGQRTVQVGPGRPAKRNTNKLLDRVAGCDGLKTGYTAAAGYCLSASAKRGDLRLIAVVMGCASSGKRFERAEELLEEGFQRLRRLRVVARGQPLDPPIHVINSETTRTRLRSLEDLWVTVESKDTGLLKVVAVHPTHILAPCPAGRPLGEVYVRLGETILARGPLVVGERLDAASWRWKLEHSVFGDAADAPLAGNGATPAP